MNMLDIDSLVDSLVSLATWPHILELSGRTTGTFHLKLLINLAPLSIACQIDWHVPLRSRQSGLLVPFLSPERSSGSAPRGPLTGVDHYVSGVDFSMSTACVSPLPFLATLGIFQFH